MEKSGGGFARLPGQRKAQQEFCATAGGLAQCDIAAMAQDDFLHQMQAKPRPRRFRSAEERFKNLRAVAEAAGGSLDDIVKVNAYLTDLDNFATFNQIMAEYFNQPYPARAAIGVAGLPKGVQVEAEAVLVLNN